MFNVLYIHGMGGGADSRIPSILREYFSSSVVSGASETTRPEVNIVAHTYDFDPEIAAEAHCGTYKILPSLPVR